jgi:hypothetical protein
MANLTYSHNSIPKTKSVQPTKQSALNKTSQPTSTQAPVPSALDSTSPQQIQNLQRSLGNRGVQRMLANRAIQAKLVVGAANDKYEAEADQMAAQVVSQQAQPAAQRQPLASQVTPVVRRKISDEPQEPAPAPEGPEEEIQTKRESGDSFEADSGFEAQLASAKTGGQALPAPLRRELEPKFGADFGRVKLHTDAKSNQLNRAVGAQAFTHGKDIYLASGKYQPETTPGKQLLAHELTHTLQQGAIKSNANQLQKSPAAGIQRMTVKFLPTANDTYVNPMTHIKLAELGETAAEGVYKHKGYTPKPGQTAPTEKATTRKLALNETLSVVAHGNVNQMQGGMNAVEMAAFVKNLLPDLPGGAQHTGNVDLTGCLTAWRPFWKAWRKPLAQQVSEILKVDYPKLKVRGYAGIMHAGESDFDLDGPIEITPWAYKVGKWATFKRLASQWYALGGQRFGHGGKAKKDKAKAHVAKMWKSGSIRKPQPVAYG